MNTKITGIMRRVGVGHVSDIPYAALRIAIAQIAYASPHKRQLGGNIDSTDFELIHHRTLKTERLR